mmetsp:Transcript_28828/g.89728  ORF Transcript_28828/g.89728 Transcript_28828/m.89728 type:complete len:488 (+) Transcript_28828:667-2130(+)
MPSSQHRQPPLYVARLQDGFPVAANSRLQPMGGEGLLPSMVPALTSMSRWGEHGHSKSCDTYPLLGALEALSARLVLMMWQLFSDELTLDDAGGNRPLTMPPLLVVDYNALSVRRTNIVTAAQMQDFMFSKREPWVQSRWIDASGCDQDAVTLRRLAVKYRLHPIALEAAISPGQRPKVDKYATHYCIIAPLLGLEQAPAADAQDPMQRASSQLASMADWAGRGCPRLWCCARGRGPRMETSHRHCPRVSFGHVCIFICCSPTSDSLTSCDTLITFQREPAAGETWERVLKELGKSYARLRQYDAQYLAYVILDVVVGRLYPVVQAYHKLLDEGRGHLARSGHLDLTALYEHKDQIQQVLRNVRPLAKMLTHIIEDDEICEGVTLYLRDVRDNAESLEEELRTLINASENLETEFEKFRSSQTERTLYRLSVISSIFLPAQFLTGVFGMNFDNMPELHWSYSYGVFWIVVISCMIPMLIFFRCGRIS